MLCAVDRRIMQFKLKLEGFVLITLRTERSTEVMAMYQGIYSKRYPNYYST